MPNVNLFSTLTGLTPYGLPYDQLDPVSAAPYNYTIERFETVSHGILDRTNWAGAAEDDVQARHVQKGALVDAWGVGGTADMDYHAYLFSAVDGDFEEQYGIFTGGGTGDGPPGQQYAIPGLSKTFYVEKDCLLLVFWTFEAIIDSFDVGVLRDEKAAVGLVFNGTHVSGQERLLPPSKDRNVDNDPTAADMYGYRRSRRWSGFSRLDCQAGENTVAMYVTAGHNIRLTRIRNRGMHALILPK